MKLRALVPVLFASFLLLIQGCNDEKGLYELFSGTLPRFELPDGDGSRYTNPESLFFTMKGNAVELEGATVRTIEGEANEDGSLNVIQQAFKDHHGLQCGFCTPGMVMSATSLLKENPKPSEAEVRDYLEGNICRCTGYQGIVNAIMAASGQDVPSVAAE